MQGRLEPAIVLVHLCTLPIVYCHSETGLRLTWCGTGEGAAGAAAEGLPGGANQPAAHPAAAGCTGCGQLPQPGHLQGQCTRYGPHLTNRTTYNQQDLLFAVYFAHV